jgi:hypothetical protein
MTVATVGEKSPLLRTRGYNSPTFIRLRFDVARRGSLGARSFRMSSVTAKGCLGVSPVGARKSERVLPGGCDNESDGEPDQAPA